MKKHICLFMILALMLSLASCGSGKWERTGYFADGSGNYLYISDPGDDAEEWFVKLADGNDLYKGNLQSKGSKLTGELECWHSDDAVSAMEVTLSKDKKDGVRVKVKDSSGYRFSAAEGAPIAVTINTDGFGYFRALTESDGLESDGYTSSMELSFMVPAAYELTARGENDWVFVKWTKNGEFFSNERKLTVSFFDSADYVAVFEYPRIHADDVAEYGDSHAATFYEYPSDFMYDFIRRNADSSSYLKGGFTTLQYEDLENYFGSSVNGIFSLDLRYSDSMDHAVVYSAGERGSGRWSIDVLALTFNSPENAKEYYQGIRDGLNSSYSSKDPASVKEVDAEGVTCITGRLRDESYGTVTEEGIYLEGSSVLLAVSSESGTSKGTEAMTNFCAFFSIPDPKD